MKKQMKWGFATLLLLLGIAAVFLLTDKDTATKPNHVLEQETKNLTNKPIPQPKTDVSIAETDKLQPSEKAETSHAHEDSTVHQGAHASQASMQQTQPADTVSEEVIYPHHELLQTHPVAALRAQARDSGHWSARYIPPFPPDDVEANEHARNVYLDNYYSRRGDLNNPVAVKARKYIEKWRHDNGAYGPPEATHTSPRYYDFFKLHWTALSTTRGLDKMVWDSNFTKEDYENANIQ